VIPLAWPNLQAYAAALSSNQRTHARKRLRALLALGPVSYQASGASDPAPLLDVYLDLEQRSWKARDDGSAAIHRNPGRVAYYRALLDDRSPLRLSFEFLLLGQRVVAGQILGTYGNRLYHLHTTFDAACAEASPATTLMLLTVRRALAGGHDALNLLPDFAYYKRRWLAEVTETRRLQVFRIWSAHGLKALLGSARRALRRAGPGHSLDHNPSRRSAEAASPALLAPASTLDQGELPPDPRLVEAARAPGAELLGPAELAQVFSFWSRGG
jgi:CelD/BcsL family acetyltransferase involved in cellulose biosynthesis